jgi:ferredoxin
MEVKIEIDACIGCGLCQAIAPDIFIIGDEGYAQTKTKELDDKNKDAAIEAMESCPTEAIQINK